MADYDTSTRGTLPSFRYNAAAAFEKRAQEESQRCQGRRVDPTVGEPLFQELVELFDASSNTVRYSAEELAAKGFPVPEFQEPDLEASRLFLLDVLTRLPVACVYCDHPLPREHCLESGGGDVLLYCRYQDRTQTGTKPCGRSLRVFIMPSLQGEVYERVCPFSKESWQRRATLIKPARAASGSVASPCPIQAPTYAEIGQAQAESSAQMENTLGSSDGAPSLTAERAMLMRGDSQQQQSMHLFDSGLSSQQQSMPIVSGDADGLSRRLPQPPGYCGPPFGGLPPVAPIADPLYGGLPPVAPFNLPMDPVSRWTRGEISVYELHGIDPPDRRCTVCNRSKQDHADAADERGWRVSEHYEIPKPVDWPLP